jgi:hypothetical protein
MGSSRRVQRQAAELVEAIAHSASGRDKIPQEDEARIPAPLSKKTPANWRALLSWETSVSLIHSGSASATAVFLGDSLRLARLALRNGLGLAAATATTVSLDDALLDDAIALFDVNTRRCHPDARSGRPRHQVIVAQERKTDFVVAKGGPRACNEALNCIDYRRGRENSCRCDKVPGQATSVTRGPQMNAFMVARTVLSPLRKSFGIAPTIAGVGVLIILSTGLASATEYNVASVPKLDVPFNANGIGAELSQKIAWGKCRPIQAG